MTLVELLFELSVSQLLLAGSAATSAAHRRRSRVRFRHLVHFEIFGRAGISQPEAAQPGKRPFRVSPAGLQREGGQLVSRMALNFFSALVKLFRLVSRFELNFLSISFFLSCCDDGGKLKWKNKFLLQMFVFLDTQM